MTAAMKRNTGLHCQACGAAAGQPCTVDCPEAGLEIAVGTTIAMLAALDLAKMPLAVAAALGVLRSALKTAQQRDAKAAPDPDPGAMQTQSLAPATWEARFAQFGGPSKEKAMEGEIADWRAAYTAHEMAPQPKPAPLIYPATLTPELEHALGFMNFRTGPMAHVYRASGHSIATKCEAEQAFVLDRMVRTVITHGDKWLDAFADDIRIAQAAAKQRLAADDTHSKR